jgi:hypothetical protein
MVRWPVLRGTHVSEEFGDEIELTPEEDAALDAFWDSVGEEEKAAAEKKAAKAAARAAKKRADRAAKKPKPD